MRVLSVEAEQFRNLQAVKMEPSGTVNLILGDNAQGKTNLLEAIWACTGCKSFRGAKERDYIGLSAAAMHLKLKFQDKRRTQEIGLHLQRGEGKQKKLLLNGVPLSGASGLFSQFQCVIFSPDDRELIRGGPEKRRSFLDLCGSQLTPAMLGCIRRFDQLTAQRNALLKQIPAGRTSKRDLEDWDLQLAKYGSLLTCLRYSYIRKLSEVCARLYGAVTAGQEKLSVKYRSNIFKTTEIPEKPTTEMQRYYYEQLHSAVEDDIRLGFTAKGAGRDDFVCKIGGLSVREFGSQGQQKSAALVLKLAQAAVFCEKKDETPVILLDDVMGELDDHRQRLVYEIIRGMQVFLTACQPDAVGEEPLQHPDSAVFQMENGVLTRQTRP
ncbi:MAG: DNA replication and repair protein RecF [Oscillospiraceae bacterium]|nr:DNA replication and repair protein RecF [Oscillospiraceae bacterium]